MSESIANNLDRVRHQIAEACRRSNRPIDSVELVAVSKMHPVSCIEEAYAAGQRLFGENRVQEMQTKAATIDTLPGALVHLIGPLQNNKTSRAAELFHSVDTLDEERTAHRLSSAAIALGRRLPVLIEVKLSHEPAKHGCSPESLTDLLEKVAELPGLDLQGLMTVPPWSEDPEPARLYFQQLRSLRDLHQARHTGLQQLSMGMSNDFSVAIEEGSTAIRVGTAIFGRRVPPAV